MLRERVRDLAQRVRTACIDRLSTILGPEAVSEGGLRAAAEAVRF